MSIKRLHVVGRRNMLRGCTTGQPGGLRSGIHGISILEDMMLFRWALLGQGGNASELTNRAEIATDSKLQACLGVFWEWEATLEDGPVAMKEGKLGRMHGGNSLKHMPKRFPESVNDAGL